MDIESLRFSEAALDAIQALRIQVELIEKTNIRASRSVDELIKLLNLAVHSEALSVHSALEKVVEACSSGQLAFFKTVGIEYEKAVPKKAVNNRYRGAQLQTQVKTSGGMEAPTSQKKRKIIYRGQVKWV